MGRDGMDLEDPGSEYSVHVFGHVRVTAWEGHVGGSRAIITQDAGVTYANDA